mmetsp:Transcript_2161/g.4524  ORF Transcript_2161/g.4524 Transcript_2161/m.4524 type:complete len:291 (+) Transcript_2161:2738-3610(+)
MNTPLVISALDCHLWCTLGVKLEEESLVLRNGIHLGDHSFPLRLLLTVILTRLGSSSLVLEKLNKSCLNWIGTSFSSFELGNGSIQGSLFECLIRREFLSDRGSCFRHKGNLGLLGDTGLFMGNHVQHALNLGLEVVLGLDGSSGVELLVGGGTDGIDGLEVVDHVLVGFEILELMLKCGNNFLFRFGVLLEEVHSLLVESLVNGIPTLCIKGYTKCQKHGKELGLLIDDIPFQLDHGDGSSYSDWKCEPLRKTGSKKASFAFDGESLSLGLLFATGRSVETHLARECGT